MTTTTPHEMLAIVAAARAAQARVFLALAAAALTAALVLLAPAAARAESDWTWTRTDTAFEATYLAGHLVDWGNTTYIAGHGDRYWEEVNPILGKHPSRSKVHLYMASSAIVHVAVARLLPNPYRRVWQVSTLGFKAYLVGKNYQVGIGWEMKF